MKSEAIIMEQIRIKALAKRSGKGRHAKLISRDMIFKNSRNPHEVTLSELEEGYQTIAWLIGQYGDIYLPIFIRLHKEIEAKREAQRLKSLVLKIAETNNGGN